MRKNFVKAFSAVLCMASLCASCQKEVSSEQLKEERARIEVSIPTGETKLVSDAQDDVVNNYQLFMFKADGTIEDYVSTTSSNITLDCTTGKKHLFVFVNAPSLADESNYETISKKQMLLSDNAERSIVMSGSLTIEVGSSATETVTLQAVRKVAKVVLSELKLEMDIPQYSILPFKVSSVYLINVPADTPYFGMAATTTLWYNKSGYNPDDDNTLIYDDMGDFQITEQTPYTTQNTFYCCPNKMDNDSFNSIWSPRHTRLVVEATLGETKYYYPVTLPKMDANKVYSVHLTITRPGLETPDAEFSKFDEPFQITIKEWMDGGSVSKEY